MKDKKRPKYIINQVNEINKIFRNIRLKDSEQYKNDLFMWFTNHLSKNGWYRGYSFYIDKEVNRVVKSVLAGPEFMNMDHYIQLF